MNTNTPLQWPMNLLVSDRQDPLAGSVTLERWRLFFQAGDVEVALPWTGIRVHTAGGEDDQVFFSHPDFQNFTFFTEDGAILKDPAFQQVIDLRRQVAHFDEQAKAKGFRRTTLIFLLCFAVLTGLLFVAANAVVHLAVRNFPAEWEADIGNQALLEIASQSSIDRNSEKALELTKLVHRIAPRRSHRDKLKVFLLNEAHPNAFAVPGGTILVTTGLLEMTEEPSEIAGVLAHEIAHIQHRHGLRIYVKAAGPAYALRILLGDRGSGKALASTSTFLLMQRFSRDHELAADASAVKLLERGGFDPNGLADFLRRLMAYSGEALAPEILLSHPPTPERLQALQKLVSG